MNEEEKKEEDKEEVDEDIIVVIIFILITIKGPRFVVVGDGETRSATSSLLAI